MPRLVLHDVDAERLAAWVVGRSGLDRTREDREDPQQHLLLTIWQLSREFDPASGRHFAPFPTTVRRRRVVDWQRKTFGRDVWKFSGRTHFRRRPEFVSLDADDSESQSSAWRGSLTRCAKGS